MTTIYGEETVPARTKTIVTGVKCDVCGKEASKPEFWGWGLPKGWYRVEAHSDFSTDRYFADACGLSCLMEIAKDVRFIQGHSVLIIG